MTQFVLFLLAGGVAAVLNWSSRFLFSRWMSFELAVVAAYSVGMVTAFVLMRTYVFRATHRRAAVQIPAFVLVNVLALAQTLVASVMTLNTVLPALGVKEHAEAIAHLVGVLFPVVTSFVGHKWATFR